jgi:cell division protein FtsB
MGRVARAQKNGDDVDQAPAAGVPVLKPSVKPPSRMVESARVEADGMITRQRRKSPLNRLWVPVLAIMFLGYFGYHAFTGSYGLWSLDRLGVEAETLKAQLETLKTERAGIERQVAFLKPDSLDADVIDTEARTSLNLLRPDEVVISFGAVQHRP